MAAHIPSERHRAPRCHGALPRHCGSLSRHCGNLAGRLGMIRLMLGLIVGKRVGHTTRNDLAGNWVLVLM